VAVAATALAACGESGDARLSAAPVQSPAPATAAAPMAGSLLAGAASHPAGGRIDMSRPVRQTMQCDYSARGVPTLAGELQSVSPDGHPYRAAALVAVVSIGAAVWNTPDGGRPAQAAVDADPLHPPTLYTPYTFTVQRVVAAGAGLSAGQTVTGYVWGGTTPFGDSVQSCLGQPTVAPVHPGWSAVVIFGGELAGGSTSAGRLQRPVVSVFDIVRGNAVVTYRGIEPIP
jgi:hypothetical protein